MFSLQSEHYIMREPGRQPDKEKFWKKECGAYAPHLLLHLSSENGGPGGTRTLNQRINIIVKGFPQLHDLGLCLHPFWMPAVKSLRLPDRSGLVRRWHAHVRLSVRRV